MSVIKPLHAQWLVNIYNKENAWYTLFVHALNFIT